MGLWTKIRKAPKLFLLLLGVFVLYILFLFTTKGGRPA